MNRLKVALLFAITVMGVSQDKHSRPEFSQHSVKEIYTGTPVPPKLSKDQRRFRTMIRKGAKSKVEFAGHYTVPRWGCGTSCNEFVIVDSRNGTVYDVPFFVVEPPGAWFVQNNPNEYKRMEYYPNSRLLKINGCPNDRDCGFYDYLMVDGKGLQLIRKQLLPREFQVE